MHAKGNSQAPKSATSDLTHNALHTELLKKHGPLHILLCSLQSSASTSKHKKKIKT
jgi:hypothetical protein